MTQRAAPALVRTVLQFVVPSLITGVVTYAAAVREMRHMMASDVVARPSEGAQREPVKLCHVFWDDGRSNTIPLPAYATFRLCASFKNAVEGHHYKVGCAVGNTVKFAEEFDEPEAPTECRWID